MSALETTDDELEFLAVYCPDCSSCGEWGCCPYDCDKCRNPDTWEADYSRMWDIRKPENQPKKPVGYKHYPHWEDMDKAWDEANKNKQ